MTCNTTHHLGCDCHERKWAEKLAKAEKERDEAWAVLNLKSGEIIAIIADALIRMPEDELDDHSYHMGAARARASIIQEVQRFLGVTK